MYVKCFHEHCYSLEVNKNRAQLRLEWRQVLSTRGFLKVVDSLKSGLKPYQRENILFLKAFSLLQRLKRKHLVLFIKFNTFIKAQGVLFKHKRGLQLKNRWNLFVFNQKQRSHLKTYTAKCILFHNITKFLSQLSQGSF